MSIKRKVANIYDKITLDRRNPFAPKLWENIALTPVFHVEKLYNDRYFDELERFLKEYLSRTSRRAVITCMTPHSPILVQQMKDVSFSPEKYWDRISQLGEHGLVGLHGHFVRHVDRNRVLPMHSAFYDLEVINEQISLELGALKERNLVDENLLIYSGGWWHTSHGLRRILRQHGFKWDYTLSSSSFNVSPGSHSIKPEIKSGVLVETVEGHEIKSAMAVSSISQKGRPFCSIRKITAEHKTYPAAPVNLSLYSHDYDLACDAALQMVDRYLLAGITFQEPTLSNSNIATRGHSKANDKYESGQTQS